MFKLPICPHCHTIYRYGDVKKTASKREISCYNCGKTFKIKRKKLFVLAILTVLAALLVDIFELSFINGINGAALIVTNILLVITAFLLAPFFIDYKADFDSKSKKR